MQMSLSHFLFLMFSLLVNYCLSFSFRLVFFTLISSTSLPSSEYSKNIQTNSAFVAHLCKAFLHTRFSIVSEISKLQLSVCITFLPFPFHPSYSCQMNESLSPLPFHHLLPPLPDTFQSPLPSTSHAPSSCLSVPLLSPRLFICASHLFPLFRHPISFCLNSN